MLITIPAHELAARRREDGLLLVDVRSVDAWREGTIPGAIFLNVYDYFIPSSDEEGIRALDAALVRAFHDTGIDNARTVVYFEEHTGMISPRALWFHEYARRQGGLILDGGIAAWRACGGEVVPGTGTADAVTTVVPIGARESGRRELLATTIAVADRDRARTDLLDVRRRSEFEGTFVHPCCARPGRIPGSRFLFWEDVIVDGCYRPPEEIVDLARKAGLDPGREVITYCHRGARAATVAYALRMAGFERVSVYVGSWHEWAERADLPVATGSDD